MNLAKALLVSKRQFSYRALNEKSIFHGLQADLQENLPLLDYKIKVFPPQYRLHNNVFAHLYKVITGDKWPFSGGTEISVGDIAGHSQAISSEWQKLYGVEHELLAARSLLRSTSQKIWYEVLVPKSSSDKLIAHTENWGMERIDNAEISDTDKSEWLLALRLPARHLMDGDLVRSPVRVTDQDNDLSKTMQKVIKDALKYLGCFAIPSLDSDPGFPYWIFVPTINIAGEKLKWHPLLSGYLISFALSTILRYQPQILKAGTPNYFIAEGWCSQSSIMVLQYFLMYFTNPPLHIKTV
ncbi:MAG: hypothetical protein HN736_19245 [Anaerolineae bacterium]|nr:hypothetical protein [Anaerolineae bacterium]MBT3713462.1 hypothetical protein [Anaerolineae bacterium]MBT4308885.1 hypothetical protein [Anaerolineae bacterium]MBT4458692.1 hypothetical protein [Anaerolineae bacterium]MBT4841719.1 hypothetical protein [Anaerolineae bacterium]